MDTLSVAQPSSLTNTGGHDHMTGHMINIDQSDELDVCSTILVEPGCSAQLTKYGDVVIKVRE